tara:strand:+ start:916 stop:1212 length:297 start_codon:yes stop_codon:yes gene_type:complete
MKTKVKDLLDINGQILQVRAIMADKHPNSKGATTVEVLFWDDNTTKVVCRHATPDAKLCIASHYKGKLGYKEEPLNMIGDSCMIHANGTRYHKQPVNS